MKSLHTALRLLEEFGDKQSSWGVGELAEKCALPKSQVSKILSTFREHGLLDKDPQTQRYSVGMKTFTIGARVMVDMSLTREALPIMHELVAKSGHSVRLSIVDHGRAIYLLSTEGPLLLHTGWRAGTTLPWHATSAGRVLLAFASEEMQDDILNTNGLPAITSHTVTDRKVLKELLAKTREQGYAVVRNESTLGLGAISVPVLGRDQKVVATLSLAFPEHAIEVGKEQPFIDMLHDSARLLSSRNGSSVYSFRFSTASYNSGPAAARPVSGSRRNVKARSTA